MKKKFLAVYTGTPEMGDSKWNQLSDADKKQKTEAGMKAWGEWAQKYTGQSLPPT